MELDLPSQRQVPPFSDLATAIQRAAEAAAALSDPSSSSHAAAAALSDPSSSSHAAAAADALREAHAAIDCILYRLDAPAAGSSDNDQPMENGCEDGEGEQMVGEVEEGLRECALQGSKRRKRPVPPSWPLGRRSTGASVATVVAEPVLDVEGRRRAAMGLLLQFHA